MAGGGFTLVEILVVMTITSLLTVGIHRAYQQAYQVWARAEGARPAYTCSNQFFDRMRTELSGIYVPPPKQDAPASAEPELEDQRAPSGEIGIPAFELQQDREETFRLAFYTVTPAWGRSLGLSRISRVSYTLVYDAPSETFVLTRGEQLCAGDILIGDESQATILTGLAGLSVWISDPKSEQGAAWRQSYQSKGSMPRAIRIQLIWPTQNTQEDLSFEMVFAIPCEQIPEPEEEGPKSVDGEQITENQRQEEGSSVPERE